MAIDRQRVAEHASSLWYKPCADGLVWLGKKPIIVANERAARKLSAEWVPVFLQTDDSWYADGLFFIRSKQVPRLHDAFYHTMNIPESDKILVQNWGGLNDCTHFVSECLSAGGVIIHQLNVGDLVKALQARRDVQTLAEWVDFRTAQRIVRSGAMKLGDVIAFGTSAKNFGHAHAVIYMDFDKVCAHTHLNGPEYSGGNLLDMYGNWERYTLPETGHTRVLLFHFKDALAVSAQSSMLGYWHVTWRGQVYYYYFEASGAVSYGSHAPTNKTQAPAVIDGKGYWFDLQGGIKICWTKTGSLESFYSKGDNTMSGTWNLSEPISATKL